MLSTIMLVTFCFKCKAVRTFISMWYLCLIIQIDHKYLLKAHKELMWQTEISVFSLTFCCATSCTKKVSLLVFTTLFCQFYSHFVTDWEVFIFIGVSLCSIKLLVLFVRFSCLFQRLKSWVLFFNYLTFHMIVWFFQVMRSFLTVIIGFF